MRKLGLILVIGLFAMGCSKDQKVVKNLASGDWEITAISVDGESIPDSLLPDFVYTFEECKVKKGDCDGSYTYEDPDKGQQTQNFSYSISEKGTMITITTEIDILGIVSSETVTADIVENSDSKFIWSSTDDEDGTVTETTIEKV